MDENLEAIRADLEKLGLSANSVAAILDVMIKKLKKQTVTIDEVTSSVNDLDKELKKGRKSFIDLGPDIRQLSNQIEDLTENAKDLADQDKIQELERKKQILTQQYLTSQYKKAGQDLTVAIGKEVIGRMVQGTKTLVSDIQDGGSGVKIATDLMTNTLDMNQAGFSSLANAGKSVGSAMMMIPGPTMAVGAALTAVSSAFGFLTEQATDLAKFGINVLAKEVEKTVKAFNNSTAAGALFAKGMDDIRTYSSRAGLTVDQFSEVLKNNSQVLAESGLTVETAARAVADVTSRLAKDTGKSGLSLQREMMNLGIGFQEQADLVAQVMVGYKRAGMQATNREVAMATVDMAKNMKAMADIMGEEAKGRQEAAKQQAAQYAFAAKINELAKKYGDPTLPMRVTQSLAMMSESQRNAAIQTTVLGGATTDVAALLMDGGSAARTFTSNLESGRTSMQDLTEGTTRLNDRLQSGTDEMGRALSTSSIAIGANADIAKAYSEQYADSFKMNSANLNKALTDADKLSGSQGELQNSIMGAEQQAQQLRLALQNELTPAIKNFGKVVNNITSQLHAEMQKLGIGSGGVAGQIFHAIKTGLKLGVEGIGAVTGAIGGGLLGSTVGPVGTVVGAGAGGYAGGHYAGEAFESVFGYAQGGIASGPVSGFSATLHGTEAVVPLPDGKTIPVETKQVGPSYDTKIMADMLQELKNGHQSTIQAMNELVRHTKTTASYSSQLVQLAS